MSPSAYSLIGIPGLGAAGGSATQVSTYADPDTNGNIAGVLIPDVNSNYAFVYSTFVRMQTSAGPNRDTIMFGKMSGNKVAFQAPPLPAGAQGGFRSSPLGAPGFTWLCSSTTRPLGQAGIRLSPQRARSTNRLGTRLHQDL